MSSSSSSSNHNKTTEEKKREAEIALVSRLCPMVKRPVTLGDGGPSAFKAYQPALDNAGPSAFKVVQPTNPAQEDGDFRIRYDLLPSGDITSSSTTSSDAASPSIGEQGASSASSSTAAEEIVEDHSTAPSTSQGPADEQESEAEDSEQTAVSKRRENRERGEKRTRLVASMDKAPELDQTSNEYAEQFDKARRRCDERPIYRDEKIRIWTSTFNRNATSDCRIPQIVKEKTPTSAYQLYSVWRREESEVPLKEKQIRDDRKEIKKNEPAVYKEWIKRGRDLYDEQVAQLEEKLLRVEPAKKKAKRTGDDNAQKVQRIDLD